jgi:hypothetical protein
MYQNINPELVRQLRVDRQRVAARRRLLRALRVGRS